MVTRNEILKYTVLPGLIPRIVALFRSGFVHMAYMMAIIYGNVRLLPPGHPYLLPQNIGRFGIRHVVAEAANHLTFTRQNTDQIIIFFTILAGLILLLLQFILLIAAIMAEQPAYALTVAALFENPHTATGSLGPAQDIAFIILDRVFGIGDGTVTNNMFNSCISNLGQTCTDMDGNPLPTPTAFPFPFHIALHSMLQFYSYGIFLVGVFVIIYFVITIAAETAQTGTPFGQRFNKAWTPVRFIVFFALLIPLETGATRTAGLNGAQLITFKVVQMGSNMASNGWAYFNGGGTATNTVSNNYMTQQQDIVAVGKIPEVNDLMQAIYVARTCAAAYSMAYGTSKWIDAYVIRSHTAQNIVGPLVTGPAPTVNAITLSSLNYAMASSFAVGGNLIVRFGKLSPSPIPNDFSGYKGNVKPYCGEVTLPLTGSTEPGVSDIREAYYNLIHTLWADDNFKKHGKCTAQKHMGINNACTDEPTQTWAAGQIDFHKDALRTSIQNGINAQRANGAFNVPPALIERGWAGAAIWYNRIAAMNGAVTSATLGIPKLSRVPLLMEVANRSNISQNEDVSSEGLFSQNMADGLGINVLLDINDKDREILNAMRFSYEFWVQNGGAQLSNFVKPTGNIVIDFVNTVLGTSGIFEMRNNTTVHPLAQLSALGKGMMDATVRNAAYGAVLGGISGMGFKLNFLKSTAAAGTKFFTSMMMASAAIAFVLYYVLPFLPFIYFFFAISGWIKSIFEAMVAMPLWALAHLRIDGEGMPGPGAANGYFLLLEIFLRPILIIFGFIASIAIFAALVNILNDIFDLVVANVGGYDQELEAKIATGAITGMISKLNVSRGPIDEFFYTAMYAIICYIMGLASFKLIDTIPNNILRWMGVSVSTLQENAGDPAGQLTQQVYRGTQLTVNQASGQMQGNLALIAID